MEIDGRFQKCSDDGRVGGCDLRHELAVQDAVEVIVCLMNHVSIGRLRVRMMYFFRAIQKQDGDNCKTGTESKQHLTRRTDKEIPYHLKERRRGLFRGDGAGNFVSQCRRCGNPGEAVANNGLGSNFKFVFETAAGAFGNVPVESRENLSSKRPVDAGCHAFQNFLTIHDELQPFS